MLRDLRKDLRDQQRERRANPDLVPEPLLPTLPQIRTVATGLTADQRAEALSHAHHVHPRLAQSLERLNPQQLQAVVDDGPATLVRAQVGSGKTTVLVHKVLWLHLVQQVPMRDIAVLTFTHKAAGEIRTRLEALAAETGQMLDHRAFWLTGTFHGVARTLLRELLPITELGWQPDFTVLDESTRLALWQRVIATHGLNIRYVNKLAQRVGQLRQGKTRMGAMKNEDDIRRLVALAVGEKKRLNVLDFDDLLDTATWLLTENPPVQSPQWLLVDEFQDCDPAELAFVRALRGEGPQPARFFAVGDPHQVIYAWRGSSPKLFDDTEESLGCLRLDLPVNYRSTPQILDGARAVLGWQGAQSPLHGDRPNGQKITVRRHHNPHLESMYLAGRIGGLQAAGLRLRDIAILFRMRRQAQAMHGWLSAAGIACVEPARVAVDERPAAAWLLGVLRVGLQPVDADDVRALMVDPHFGPLAPKHWLKRSFAKWCAEHAEISQGAALARSFLGRKSASRDHAFAASQLDLWTTLPTWLDAHPTAETEALWQHLDLGAALRPTSARFATDQADARLLLDRLTGWMTAHGQTGAAGLRAALDLLAMGGLPALGETADPALDAVALLTLHAAKGLEFRHVFISGANQGLIPLQAAWGDAEVDAEERRLLFVGLTRARDSVEISYHNQPAHPQAQPVPSPYLYQMPPHAVDWLDATHSDVVVPALPTPPSEDRSAPLPFAEGARVRHPRYGLGTVVASQADAVEVRFDKIGVRSFDRQLCPLTAE